MTGEPSHSNKPGDDSPIDVDAIVAAIRRRTLPADAVAAIAAAVQAAEPPRWVRKTVAARELGISIDVVRRRCRRRADPVPTCWADGRELVDVAALRLELEHAGRRPQTTASDPPELATT